MKTQDHQEHAGQVSGMFGRIAGWYDFLNHGLSLGLDIYWRRRLVQTVIAGPTGRFLDLAAGTMDVTKELRKQHPQAQVLAVDFALPMLQKGQPKLGKDKYFTQPVLADGRAIPLPDNSVDAVTIAFGIRNIKPRQAAYEEILRVLTPGGRLCILEFGTSKRRIWKGLYNFYLNKLLPLAGRIVSGDSDAYRYLADTIAEFPTAEALKDELQAAGFVNPAHSPLSSGIVNVHVAEKKRFMDETFVVAPPKEKPQPEAPAEPATPKSATGTPEPVGTAPVQKVDPIAAGLEGLAKAEASAQKEKPATKAKPKKKAPAKKAAPKAAAKKKPAAKKKAVTKKAATKKAEPKATAKKKPAASAAKKKTAGANKTTAAAAKKKPAAKKAAPKTAAKTKKAAPKKSSAAKAPAKKKAAPKKKAAAPKKAATKKTK